MLKDMANPLVQSLWPRVYYVSSPSNLNGVYCCPKHGGGRGIKRLILFPWLSTQLRWGGVIINLNTVAGFNTNHWGWGSQACSYQLCTCWLADSALLPLVSSSSPRWHQRWLSTVTESQQSPVGSYLKSTQWQQQSQQQEMPPCVRGSLT